METSANICLYPWTKIGIIHFLCRPIFQFGLFVERFLPVKSSSDLLLVMSNLYSMKFGALSMSSKVLRVPFMTSKVFSEYPQSTCLQRMFPSTPIIKLSDNYFHNVAHFLKRFGSIPDLLELDHLTVSGDVTFGKGVSLRVGLL